MSTIRDLECQAAKWLDDIIDAENRARKAMLREAGRRYTEERSNQAISPDSDKGRAMSDKEKKKAAGNESAPKPEKTEEQIIMGSLNFVVKQQAKLSPTGRTRLARMLTGFLSEG